jgi:hypothetical protein
MGQSKIFFLILNLKKNLGWAPVAYGYNPSYSGGSFQEDHSSKSTQANSS